MADTIRDLLNDTADQARAALEHNTVLGEPVTIDGVTVIPVYQVSFGFAGGGFEGKEGSGLSGGAGAGVTKKPVGYLTLQDGRLQVHSANEKGNALVDKLVSLLKRGKKKE